MSMSLRHHQYAVPERSTPPRRPEQRGASRLVAREPLSLRLPKPDFSPLKRLIWPVLLVVLGVAAYEGAQRALPYVDRPISKVSVDGELSYISQQAVQQRIAPYIQASFLQINLSGMRQELEQMPWIAHAEVRRVWPDQIMIRLEEHLPVARWGDEALLNNAGHAFAPRESANYQHLPRLAGPQRAQRQVMQQYQMLSQMLRPLGLSISTLEMRERGSWYLSTAQGIEVLLGREHIVEKMRRLAAIYERALKAQQSNIARIDLRYPSGLAVAWREPVAPTAAKTAAVQ